MKVTVPDQLARMSSPRSRPLFKIKEEVARDTQFQDTVKVAMEEWEQVRLAGLPVLSWWELIIKPGIRKIAMSRSKEINEDRKGHLNLLLLRQAYLVRKIQHQQVGQWHRYKPELLDIQLNIQNWYKKSAEKIKHQSRVDEFQVEEKTRIYHHEIHKKHIKKSSIMKLMTETGLVEGHEACANHLESMVADLLLKPAELTKMLRSNCLLKYSLWFLALKTQCCLHPMTRMRCSILSKKPITWQLLALLGLHGECTNCSGKG